MVLGYIDGVRFDKLGHYVIIAQQKSSSEPRDERLALDSNITFFIAFYTACSRHCISSSTSIS